VQRSQQKCANRFKADWHTVVDSLGPIGAFVPRTECSGELSRAPDNVVAFAEAFRDVNSAVWQAIIGRLKELAEQSHEELEGLCNFMCAIFEQKQHFGVAELEIVAGDNSDIKYRTDGMTSLLHLRVAIGGTCILHVSWSPDPSSAHEKSEVFVLGAGHVCVSSPAVFLHHVQYDSSTWADRAVILHLRLLFKPHWWVKKYVNQQRDRDMAQIVTAIVSVLQTERLRLPTVLEVKEHETSEVGLC